MPLFITDGVGVFGNRRAVFIQQVDANTGKPAGRAVKANGVIPQQNAALNHSGAECASVNLRRGHPRRQGDGIGLAVFHNLFGDLVFGVLLGFRQGREHIGADQHKAHTVVGWYQVVQGVGAFCVRGGFRDHVARLIDCLHHEARDAGFAAVPDAGEVAVIKQHTGYTGGQGDARIQRALFARLQGQGDTLDGCRGLAVEGIAVFAAGYAEDLSVRQADPNGRLAMAHSGQHGCTRRVCQRAYFYLVIYQRLHLRAGEGRLALFRQAVDIAVVEGMDNDAGRGHDANGLQLRRAVLPHGQFHGLAACVAIRKQRRAAGQGKHDTLRQIRLDAVFARLEVFKAKFRVLGGGDGSGDVHLKVRQGEDNTGVAALVVIARAVHVAVMPDAAAQRAGFDAANAHADAAFQHEGLGHAAVVLCGGDYIVEGINLLAEGANDIGIGHGNSDAVGGGCQFP